MIIVVVTPRFDQLSGMTQTGEQVLFEAFVPQAAIEALDVELANAIGSREPATVLPGLARCDERHSTVRSFCDIRIAFEVSSVP